MKQDLIDALIFAVFPFFLLLLIISAFSCSSIHAKKVEVVAPPQTIECKIPEPPIVADTLPSKCLSGRDGASYCCLYLIGTNMKNVACGMAECLIVEDMNVCPTQWKLMSVQCGNI
jgi:hypothetical protein